MQTVKAYPFAYMFRDAWKYRCPFKWLNAPSEVREEKGTGGMSPRRENVDLFKILRKQRARFFLEASARKVQ